MKNKEIIIDLEDLTIGYRQKLAQSVLNQWKNNLKEQGVKVCEYKMELTEVINER